MARREQREEANPQEAEASQARLLSARLSETHSPRDLERMDTPSPLPSSPVVPLNQIEAMQAAQGIPLSPTVQIVNQGFDFSPASFEELWPESQSILDSLMPPPPAPRTSSPAGVGVPVRNVSRSPTLPSEDLFRLDRRKGEINLDGDHHHHRHQMEVTVMAMTADRVMGMSHLDRDGVGCLRIVGIYKTPSNRCRTGNKPVCAKRMCNR